MEQLKSSDLRIGNYVFADTGMLCLDTHKLLPKDFIDLINGKLKDKIKPIPLNEEWLIKFGFERFNKNFYCIDNMSLWEGSLNYNINDKFITLSEGMGNSELMLCKPLEYVHQLQNLYYCLTNEELTIKD